MRLRADQTVSDFLHFQLQSLLKHSRNFISVKVRQQLSYLTTLRCDETGETHEQETAKFLNLYVNHP